MLKVQAPINQDIQIQTLNGPKLVPAGAGLELDMDEAVAQKLGFIILETTNAQAAAQAEVMGDSAGETPVAPESEVTKRATRSRK